MGSGSSDTAPARPLGLSRLSTSFKAGAVLFVAALVLGFVLRGCMTPSPPKPGDTEHTGEPSAATQVWTCSMHPQIRMPQPGQCPLCGMDLIPVSEAGADSTQGSLRTYKASESAKALMELRTHPVERKFVTAEIRMAGKVDYDETRLGYITAWVPGRLDRLYVDYTGVKVNKGDHMVYLYSPEILAAQEELRRSATTVANMRADAPEILRKTAQTTLEAAREKLGRWGLTEEQLAEAEKKGTISDHITIYAPMGGTVIERMGQEGMYVETGTTIYTIADLSEVWVLLDAYESDLSWIHYGQTVEFSSEAYPGEVFEGKIAFIDPVLNDMTRTVKVRVNVPNKDGRLKPEMFVRAVVRAQLATGGRVADASLAGKWISPMHPEIVKDHPGTCDICGMALVRAETLGYVPAKTSDEDKPLVIPASAALITGKRAIVYVELPGMDDPTYEGREVVLGPRAGDYYLVRSGLEEGEILVTNGNFKIDSALQILAKPSMMTPDGGAMPGEDAELNALPAALLEQLAALDAGYGALREAVESGEHEKTRQALDTLEGAMGAVDMKLFPPAAHAEWMEYSMRLKNDLLILGDAANGEERRTALDTAKETLSLLHARLGLEKAKPSGTFAPAEFRNSLIASVEAYLTIHSALATDDLAAAQGGAKKLDGSLTGVPAGVLQASDREHWETVQAKELSDAVQRLGQAKDIEEFRKHFKSLSDGLVDTLRRFGVPDALPLHVMHCPMAFDNTGADWLQRDPEVRNPYFGNAMLNCGEMVTHLTPPEEPSAASGHEGHAHAEGQAHE